MMNRIIGFCLNNRPLVIFAIIFLVIAGIWGIKKTPIDAIPDIGEKQVTVYTDWMGRSPQDVEDQITYPLTINLLGLPKVKVIRCNSMFGFSMVNIIFEDNVDYYWARTRILERLDFAKRDLPPGVTPILGPDATALGQVFWYTVEGEGYDLGELRTIQDWYVKYQLNSVPGVSEVASVGGFVKEYQVDIDPNKLLAYSTPASEVIMAIKKSNIDVGAKIFTEGGIEFIIRGLGFIKSVSDIENIVVGAYNGVPVLVKNIGTVTTGPAFRRGALDKEGAEVVGGVVLMRYGENPISVIQRVKEKIKEIEGGLPSGVKIVPFYDRTGLINRGIATLRNALIQEIIITSFVVVIFLLHFGSSFIISMVLPIGILIGFVLMRIAGVDGNIMSLGGIAIAIGVMVDSGIVLTESIYLHLQEKKPTSNKDRLDCCLKGAQKVAPSVLTALLTTVVSFIPVFALTGQAGRLFRPLAFTKTFVICGAGFLAITLVPVLSYYLLRGKLRSIEDNMVSRKLHQLYLPTIKWLLNHRALAFSIVFSVFIIGAILSKRIKSEFMPPLNEGDLLFMPVLLPGAALTQVMDVMKKQDIIIKSLPEVEWVVGKLGRAETATDPAPVAMIETIIHLKPEKYWRKGVTRDSLVKEMVNKTKIPGVSPIMTQPIRNRIDMLATGIQTPIGIKVFGSDLKKIQEMALQIESIIKTLPGASNIYAERIGVRPYFEIEIDRSAIARYGIKIEDVQEIIMTAIGGEEITRTVEGRERYPVRVRYMRELRDNPSALNRVFVSSPSGALIPLGQLAKLRKKPGPAGILSENSIPYMRIFITIDPKVIGLVDFVNLGQKTIKDKIASGELEIPSGYHIEWSGQYESELEARRRLITVVPICLLVIIFLLYMNFKDFTSVMIVMSALPLGMSFSIITFYFWGFNFSTVVWVGFIALFGVATDNGVLLVNTFNMLIKERGAKTKDEIRQIVIDGVLLRARPTWMTSLTTIIALSPIMFFTSAGSELMKPMALPTIGGLIYVTITNNLLFIPLIYSWIKERQITKGGE